MNLEKLFLKEIENLGPWEDQPEVAIALSGGVDSMVLTWLANNWAISSRGKILALIIDHQLRKESKDEILATTKFLNSHNIDYKIIAWEGEKPKSNIQETARNARYKLLTDYCKNNNILHLLLAHHKDDQAETFYLRLERGSGVNGLACMARTKIINGVRIIRPLLKYNKINLIDYAKENEISWIEDPSNNNDKFRRSFIRKELSVNTLFSSRLADAANNIGRARASLENTINKHIVDIIDIYPEGYAYLDYIKLLNICREEGLNILSRILQIISGNKTKLRFDSLENLYNNLSKFKAALTIGGCKLSKNSGKILVTREIRKNIVENINAYKNIIFDNRFYIENKSNKNYSVTCLKNFEINKDLRKILKNKYHHNVIETLPVIFESNILKDFYILPLENQTVKSYFKPHLKLTNNIFEY